MKVKAKGGWKSIPLPQSIFTGGIDSAMCGGIEILDDYSIQSEVAPSAKLGAKPLKKRKIENDIKESAKKKKFNFVEIDLEPSSKKVEETVLKENVPKKKKKKVPLVIKQDEGGVIKVAKPEIKKKKKNKKKSANKPVINLEALTKRLDKKSQSDSTNSTANPESPKPDVPKIKTKEKVKEKKMIKEKEKEETTTAPGPCKPLDMNQWREVFVCEEIIKALEEKGFSSPTPIQKLTLPAALKGRMDIVGAAETGSGKTLAFGIPIVQGILNDRIKDMERKEEEEGKEKEHDNDEDHEVEEEEDDLKELLVGKKRGDKLRALILTPTRELAMQIKNHIQAIITYTDISVMVLVGGISPDKQLRLLKRRPEIVVATPGRLWDLVQEGVPHLSNLPDIRYLAIDETDRMGEKGHFEELQKLLEMIRAESTGSRQNFVMSATLSLVHKPPAYSKGKQRKQKSSKEKLKELMEFAGVSERSKVVDITRKVGTAESLTESVIHCELEEKDAYLYYFIKAHKGRTIVFCNSIDCVRRLTNLFSLLDNKPLPLHAQLHQKARLKNLDRFTSSDVGLLIATDVAARGLDIPNIQHVVHYQVPRTSEGYIHRSGRTARASKSGISVLLIDPSELYLYKKLCVTLTRKTDLPSFPVDSARFGNIMTRMESARRLDKLLLQARKKSVGENWMQKAAEEADLVLSDDDYSDGEKDQEAAVSKQKIQEAKRELQYLLRTPLVVSEFSGRYPTQSGCLPAGLLNHQVELNAVETLQSNISKTGKLLKKKSKPSNGDRKFKGFKKKKMEKRNQKSE